ncbi:MAG TPA: hypothetical protein VMI10_07130 [Terriglobales bacterium]|nr:hypothetical protein [Terriglobales bacterium]
MPIGTDQIVAGIVFFIMAVVAFVLNESLVLRPQLEKHRLSARMFPMSGASPRSSLFYFLFTIPFGLFIMGVGMTAKCEVVAWSFVAAWASCTLTVWIPLVVLKPLARAIWTLLITAIAGVFLFWVYVFLCPVVIVDPRVIVFNASVSKENFLISVRNKRDSYLYGTQLQLTFSPGSAADDFSYDLPTASSKPIIEGSGMADISGVRCAEADGTPVLIFQIYRLEPEGTREISITNQHGVHASIEASIVRFSMTPQARIGDPMKMQSNIVASQTLTCSSSLMFWLNKESPPNSIDLSTKKVGSVERDDVRVHKAAVPKEEKPPTLPSLFAHDFNNTLRKTTDIDLGSSNPDLKPVRIKVQLYLDFPAKTKYIGFYIPAENPLSSKETVAACLLLAQSAQRAVTEMSQGTTTMGGYRDQMNTEQELTFSGRVLLYHEAMLSITEQADIIRAFQANHLDVQFRGPEYLSDQVIGWQRDRGIK